MRSIFPDHDRGTTTNLDREPTADELAAIDKEMPVILADIDLLDAQIMLLDRQPNELDARRIRRAEHKLMTARRDLANSSREFPAGGAA
ncbi:DUF6284 family protein [Actinacidiphila bryophytorum]|uniref:Uncharacterized protein n=1 Tax=Actinacidiphila bryophytorum TaxID=1436133 RepID=A0A9W4MAY2_9ACTN|nr:DUF6284 family protein [Actinacidiphila bryophytorum]MBM9438726.1 hypothetical protein [Actinacidiphila bryophytorum]MBN6545543.1 hypothetical protein [Actinacidiphila bryophytorum]CAG7637612.1 hypothetical protein SBRY_30138 [Actinacidiphila bryophytorum]